MHVTKYKPILMMLLLACALMAQQTKAAPWKVYEYPADNFAIVAPSAPKVYPDPQDPNIRIYHWDFEPGIVLTLRTGHRDNCLIHLKAVTEIPDKDQPPSYVRGSMKDVSQIGLRGYESEMHHPAYWSAERVFCTKDTGYALTFGYPVNQPRPSVVDRMFNSFRLLKTSQ